MTNHPTSAEKTLTFQLKGGLYPLTALQILDTDIASFEQQLKSKIGQAPKFFHQAPVVIDLQKLNQQNPIPQLNFKQLMEILTANALKPVGIKGGTPEQQTAALSAGLPILQDSNKESLKPNKATLETKPINAEMPKPPVELHKNTAQSQEIYGTNTKVITEPVRSGQQIYVRGGDLIVLASVSHGSELLADGHIHVYGPLRGRALAGVTGDQNAHIFCQSLEAELVSIAGQYMISEDMDQSAWRLPVNISMQAGRLHVEAF